MYNGIVASKDIRFFEKYLKCSIGEIAHEKNLLNLLESWEYKGFYVQTDVVIKLRLYDTWLIMATYKFSR